jgi:DNA-binding PadR family transcriptional regulator
MTAYALREAIRDVLGHFWRESFGQIYPTLARLEDAGLVHRHSGSRPGASTFAITSEGLGRLRELLAEPVTTTPPRNGLLLRLFFGRTLGVAACCELLAATRADAEQRPGPGRRRLGVVAPAAVPARHSRDGRRAR